MIYKKSLPPKLLAQAINVTPISCLFAGKNINNAYRQLTSSDAAMYNIKLEVMIPNIAKTIWYFGGLSVLEVKQIKIATIVDSIRLPQNICHWKTEIGMM